MNAKQILYKTITYKIASTLATFAVVFTVTGSVATAAGLASADVILKVIVYAGHEIAWVKYG